MRYLKSLVLWSAVLACSVRLAAAPLKVVTTTTDLAAITRAVAGDAVEVRAVCSGKEDPHFLTAKPGFILMARDADLWIRVGMELEVGWEPPILDGSRNVRIREGTRGHLDASDRVLRLEVPTQRVTRELGDVHPQGNPHYWLDPYNGRVVAESIAARLTELAPARAAQFDAGLAAFRRALDERMFGAALVAEAGGDSLWCMQLDGTLDAWLQNGGRAAKLGGWLAAVRPLRGTSVVTYHRSWVYFTNRFGLTLAGELEPKPGVPPSGTHLAGLEALMQQQRVGLILQEPFYSRKAARRVASKTGARVVVVANTVLGEPGATDYLTLMDLVVARLTAAPVGK